jgi:hypothetical protein
MPFLKEKLGKYRKTPFTVYFVKRIGVETIVRRIVFFCIKLEEKYNKT